MKIDPPRPRGPHLNALRAFEAAARLGGFSDAATELCVTPGAVSQHVKALEEWANAPLFERRSQGVSLTPLGKSVAAEFCHAFDMLGSAQRSLRAKANGKTISIAALPSVAQLWLSPRLPAIRQELHEHTISITALEKRPNLHREMFDISIFAGKTGGSGTELILAEDIIFPVCTPAIAAKINSPADLTGQTLIHDATWKGDWAFWAEKASLPEISAGEGPEYSLYSIAVEEACNGAGILIGHGLLVDRFIRSGALVAPFTRKVPSGKSWILESTTFSGATKRVCDMLNAG